jgi:hypothetical protein
MTLQETLSAGIKKSIAGSTVKKIDKDNFLDIHLPSVNKANATHLFFNTPKGGIKIGFYCRDEEFVKKALKKSKKIESYSQGIRPIGNPAYEKANLAIKAALDFVKILEGEKEKKSVKPKAKPQVSTTSNKSSIPKKLKQEPKSIPAPKKAEEVKPQEVQLSFWQRLLRFFG